jgi:phosphohistidine swiveling domain-containing protein
MKPVARLTIAATLAGAFMLGTPALAQERVCNESTADETVETASAAQRTDQIIYKGVVGNLLEAMPIDADKRVELQRTNAIISNPLSARSIAVLIGITNPIVMLGGLVWGIWAASRIEGPAPAELRDKPEPALARVELAADAGD